MGYSVFPDKRKITLSEKLSRWAVRPLTGVPLLFIVLYYGLYQFVGVFGAGTMVDFLEKKVFEGYFNPWITGIVKDAIPWPILRELFVGEYGVITLGLRYAVGIIMPIVATFFLFFSVLEDSGYFPRLALLVDRLFKKIGLTGRAVIHGSVSLRHHGDDGDPYARDGAGADRTTLPPWPFPAPPS